MNVETVQMIINLVPQLAVVVFMLIGIRGYLNETNQRHDAQTQKLLDAFEKERLSLLEGYQKTINKILESTDRQLNLINAQTEHFIQLHKENIKHYQALVDNLLEGNNE